MSEPTHLAGPPTSAPPALDAIADAYVEQVADLDPLIATYVGIPGRDALMTDLSPEGYQARHAAAERALRAVRAVEPATPRERVAHAAMAERLATEIEYGAAGLDRALNVIACPVQDVRAIFDLMATDTEEQRANVAARLAAVPAALDGYRATLRGEVAAGRPSARRQVAACSAMIRGWLRDDVLGDVARRSGADGAQLADLEAGAAAASGAYESLAAFLDEEMAPPAREADGVGPDLYPVAARTFLGSTIDPAEAYAWGWDELARIRDEMAAVAREITGSPDVAAAKDALDADPARRIAGAEAFRDWMQERSDEAVAALAGTHFDIADPIRTLECRLAPTHDGGIYYTGPSDDLARPGRMWWSVPPGEDTFSTWKELTTVYHEGVPGHHLQVAQTVYRADLLNRWQRLLCWVSGHGEGWALYAERLMGELGFLADPGDRLGMLDARQMRAARVVIDIGCHLGLTLPDDATLHAGERWDQAIAVDVLRAHSTLAPGSLRFEVNRYLGWPGQAPSYTLGERLWLQARSEARARKGPGFDLRAFHAAALNLGPLGLDPLRAELARL
jgi:uncharacterized protein (DUF885 family)